MPDKQSIGIIGVPCDLGANIRGACMGPAAIRIAGLKHQLEMLPRQVKDYGDVLVPERDAVDPENVNSRFLPQISQLCQSLYQKVSNVLLDGHLPIILGGDHALAIGSISAVQDYHQDKGEKVGVIWVDAHSDVNTPETSPSGNIHGMPLAVLLGQGHETLKNIAKHQPTFEQQDVILLGIRHLDQRETDFLKHHGIRYYTMRTLDERGAYACIKEALDHLQQRVDKIHVSFDIDGVDPVHAPGVSTPVSGGLTFREAHLILEMIAETRLLSSMDIVELNPTKDKANQTAELAIELILSALGKCII